MIARDRIADQNVADVGELERRLVVRGRVLRWHVGRAPARCGEAERAFARLGAPPLFRGAIR